jgi:hypothetical protein
MVTVTVTITVTVAVNSNNHSHSRLRDRRGGLLLREKHNSLERASTSYPTKKIFQTRQTVQQPNEKQPVEEILLEFDWTILQQLPKIYKDY